MRQLPGDEYANVQPITLGSFFGSLCLVAQCQRDDTAGFVVIDATQATFFADSVGSRPLRAEHVYWLYKGRKLLDSFN